MTIIGKSEINLNADGMDYPLPAGDYLLVKVSTRSTKSVPKVGWAPVAEETSEPEPEPEPA